MGSQDPKTLNMIVCFNILSGLSRTLMSGLPHGFGSGLIQTFGSQLKEVALDICEMRGH